MAEIGHKLELALPITIVCAFLRGSVLETFSVFQGHVLVHFTVQCFIFCLLLQITSRAAKESSQRYGRTKCLSNADML